MKTWKDDPPPTGKEQRCTMCGEPQHTTKAEYLACAHGRRKAFADLDRCMAKILNRQKKAP